jgi:hypothetical protein
LKDFGAAFVPGGVVSGAHSLIAAIAAGEPSLRPLTILEHLVNRALACCIPLMARLIAHLHRLVSWT